MRRQSGDDPENPAWPGLVDLFALGMVVMVVLWVGAQSPDAGADRDLAAELRTAQELATSLEARLDSLQLELAAVTGDSSANDPAAVIQREQRRSARAIAGALAAVSGTPDSTNIDGNRIIKETFDGQRIAFATGSAVLERGDAERLRSFADRLDTLAAIPACEILINGQADPRRLQGRGGHPKDNVELSALRAAAVARILREANADLAARTRVVGLGEVGQLAPASVPPAEWDDYYRPLRTVKLVFRADPSRQTELP